MWQYFMKKQILISHLMDRIPVKVRMLLQDSRWCLDDIDVSDPLLVISGKVGVPGATLSYNDGTGVKHCLFGLVLNRVNFNRDNGRCSLCYRIAHE